MLRAVLAAAILAGAPVGAHAQSVSAPLIVTATVVSTCKIDVPQSADASIVATLAASVTCAKGGTTPRVERLIAPQRVEVRDTVLLINF